MPSAHSSGFQSGEPRGQSACWQGHGAMVEKQGGYRKASEQAEGRAEEGSGLTTATALTREPGEQDVVHAERGERKNQRADTRRQGRSSDAENTHGHLEAVDARV